MPSSNSLIMTNKELFYFTGKCLTLEEHPGFRAEIIRSISEEQIDWQKFVKFCSDHLVLPVIYLKFKSNSLLQYLPEELALFLKEIYDLNVTRNLQIAKQAGEICKVLNLNGIQPIVLKGVANLFDHLYHDPGERMIGDIDMLVPEKDYLRSARILECEGYSSEKYSYNVETLKHYPRLFKEGAQASVEIHRLPVSAEYTSWFNSEMINKGKKAVDGEVSCFVLSDHHKAVHNFIHSQLDNGGHAFGNISFRDMYDLYLISGRISIPEIVDQIKHKRKAIAYFDFAGQAFGLSNRFYPEGSFSARTLHLKHDLNLRSKLFYHSNRIVTYVVKRMLIGQSKQLFKSLYSRSMRRSIIDRLSKPQWYKEHLSSYRRFFSRKNIS